MASAAGRLGCRAFAVPKAGNSREELEDACAGDPETGRFAIADGASESAFAGMWASLLVETFVEKRGRWPAWLTSVRKRWQENCQPADMAWYLEEKLAEGAFATFLGVSFAGLNRWKAVAVGDCCLFLIRGERLRRAFPVRHSQDFTNHPALLCSRSHGGARKVKHLSILGDWRVGDLMVLASDALAQWFLRKVEEGEKPWMDLHQVECQEHFVAWIQQMRESKEIRNDDVTTILITSNLG
jgi:serine/threonine protein phosphatase PrpC